MSVSEAGGRAEAVPRVLNPNQIQSTITYWLIIRGGEVPALVGVPRTCIQTSNLIKVSGPVAGLVLPSNFCVLCPCFFIFLTLASFSYFINTHFSQITQHHIMPATRNWVRKRRPYKIAQAHRLYADPAPMPMPVSRPSRRSYRQTPQSLVLSGFGDSKLVKLRYVTQNGLDAIAGAIAVKLA